MALDNGEILLQRRSFTDVHELVYLLHSWQLVLEAESIPRALRPLQNIPDHLVPVMTQALAEAQAQLESSQAGTEIALRFRATPDFAELIRWGSDQLADIEGSIGEDDLHPTWRRALQLANEFVDGILEQLNRARSN